MAKVYSVYNGASVTTAAPVAITTGTVVKTMIQLSTTANREARVVEWWWEGSASAAQSPAVIELMFHGSGAATVTAYAAGDIKKYEPNSVATALSLGSTNSGFTASGEGTPAGGTFSVTHQLQPTTGYYFQYPLNREPEAAASTFIRLRNTVNPAVNAICGVAWEE